MSNKEPLPGGAPTLLTLREAARVLRMAESTVRAAVKAGTLPAIRYGSKPGARLFFTLEDLRAFITKHRTAGNGASP